MLSAVWLYTFIAPESGELPWPPEWLIESNGVSDDGLNTHPQMLWEEFLDGRFHSNINNIS